jgi:predicted  nucleic acid-binding Zn-ribbon protein
MNTDDTVQIRCSGCKSQFRDKARRILSGYSRQCPSCERIIFFEDGSPNKNIDEAFREAARVRKALREEEADIIANPSVASAEQTDDGDDRIPIVSRRPVSHRGGARSSRRS